MLQQGPTLPPTPQPQVAAPSIKAPNPIAGKNYYETWLKDHPNASGLEQDVMRKAFGAEQPTAAPAPQQQQPAIAQPQPGMQDAKKNALGRALQTA